MNWKAYNDLAWTDHIIAPPEDYGEEADIHLKAIKDHFQGEPETLLHIGCGAGGHDFHFKKHFEVTGVDLSKGQLDLARSLNPEVSYHEGDMRSFDLGRKFDVVTFPESVMYMDTREDLERTVACAVRHLNPGGVILMMAHPKGSFQENNFAYTGERDGVHVTLLENNYLPDEDTWEAVMVFIIRENGELHVHHDIHRGGLFSESAFKAVFENEGLKVSETDMNDLYDDFLLEGGEYPLKLYVLTK